MSLSKQELEKWYKKLHRIDLKNLLKTINSLHPDEVINIKIIHDDKTISWLSRKEVCIIRDLIEKELNNYEVFN